MTGYTLDIAVLDALPPLSKGKHDDTDEAVCGMEALARACGLGTTDHPECVSPVIGVFCRTLHDALPTDAMRDELIRPLLPLMVGTADDGHDQERAWICADYAVRVFAADAMELSGFDHEARTLHVLSPIINVKTALAAESAAWSAAESAAWSAAESAAWSAARSAAESAAESAAWSAAWSVALSAAWSAAKSAAESAAWSAARSAAESAAESAAWSAAWSAVWSAALSATRSAEYKKAADVLRELCEVGR